MSKKQINRKEMIDEATDIILNTEDDMAAVEFLRETLVDDFPDLDLGRMDLHEAIEVLGGSKPNKNKQTIENLTKSLEGFSKKMKEKSQSTQKKTKSSKSTSGSKKRRRKTKK